MCITTKLYRELKKKMKYLIFKKADWILKVNNKGAERGTK